MRCGELPDSFPLYFSKKNGWIAANDALGLGWTFSRDDRRRRLRTKHLAGRAVAFPSAAEAPCCANTLSRTEPIVLFAFIAEHSSAFITVGILGLVPSLGYIWYVTQQPAPTKPIPTASVARPKPNTQALASMPAAVDVSKPSPPSRTPNRPLGKNDQNQVPTEQVPVVKPVPGVPQVSETQRKAERMAELGFHHSVSKDVVEVKSPEAATKSVGAATTNISSISSAPTVNAAIVGVASAAAPVAATANPELDDILSRIDKVLAENPVMAVNTLGSSSEPGTATQTENWLEITSDDMPSQNPPRI